MSRRTQRDETVSGANGARAATRFRIAPGTPRLDRSRAVPAFAVCATLALSSCHRKETSASSAASSARANSNPANVVIRAPSTPLLDALDWTPAKDTTAIGLPAGCVISGAKRARLPAGEVRFFAPGESASGMVLGVGSLDDKTVGGAAIFGADGRPRARFPWTELGAPPVAARASTGWVAADTTDLRNGQRRAELWMEPDRVVELAEGEALEVADATCRGDRCAVLTTPALASTGPGATLFVGDPASGAFSRVDLPGGQESFAPLSIARLDEHDVVVALSANGAIALFRVEGKHVTPLERLDAPFGVYDVVLGDVPVAVEPGESIDKECTKDTFSLRLARAHGPASVIEGQVPPEAVVTRALPHGFIVAWLAPVSCKQRGRQMVHAFLMGPDGTPRTSTMAVTDARGFALSTHDDAIDLWLSTDDTLVWVTARCQIGYRRAGEPDAN